MVRTFSAAERIGAAGRPGGAPERDYPPRKPTMPSAMPWAAF